MIIVEGMDNTGKTTLIKNLVSEFKLDVRGSPSHLVGTPQLMLWVEDEIEIKYDKPPIYDRWPLISEEVYGPMLRGSSDAEGRFIGWAARMCALIIYCKPPIEKILNFGTRAQMEGVITHGKLLVKEYDKVMKRYAQQGWGVVMYDYTRVGSYSKVRSIVQQYIDKYPRRGTW